MITKTYKSSKWLIGLSFVICHLSFSAALTSCSDMLESESTRQNIDPSITHKTDSAFYAFGILQAMQELADQYVLHGEMRGDLVQTTFYTDNNLRQLANFSANTTNKYDSAYVYYRVINNCNYYLAHCDTALYNGSTNVVIDKYIATKAIRAWAYLQLGRNYERVPFFTEPLTQISQIDRSNYPEMTLEQIVGELAPDLEQYSGALVPTLGPNAISVGAPNWSATTKTFLPRLCFIPVDVILGDMYLEVGNYDSSAKHFITYLTKVSQNVGSPYIASMTNRRLRPNGGQGGGPGGGMGGGGNIGSGSQLDDNDELPDPSQYTVEVTSDRPWNTIFGSNSTNDIITYIPMAVTRQNGATSDLPLIMGFDYYSTPEETGRSGEPYIDAVQLLPSPAFDTLSDSTEYYFYAAHTNQTDMFDSVRIAKAGDMRLRSVLHQELEEDSLLQWIDKYKYGNVVLYRVSTVWLRLAECFNRLDMPDAAFAILKDGITDLLLQRYADGSYYMPYITDETRQKLQTTYPLLSTENIQLFTTANNFGIHTHGAGKAASDFPGSQQAGGQSYHTGVSPYQLDRMAGLKMQELRDVYGFNVGTTRQDTINAIEDLICDELALETAFEGNRFFDLCRMARHKNQSGLYGGNYGSQWLARKLAFKNPVVNLEDEKNWYLPFK